MRMSCPCWPVVLLFVFQSLTSSAAVHYVRVSNANPSFPYDSWATAATNIQDAIDAAAAGDQILVTNGVYQSGSRVAIDGTTNRAVATLPVSILSVNGSAATAIDGAKAMRCVYLTNGAVLSGFTLTNGNAVNGGGAYCASTNVQLFNCQVSGNSATYGGGVYSGTLSNCTVSGNSVVFAGSGGGAYNSTLLNCTIAGNSTLVNGGSGAGAVGGFLANCTINNNTCNGSGATVGGGVSGSVVTNCTLSGNRALGAGASGGAAYSSVLINCTLSNNSADYGGGGAYNSSLTNCTVANNHTGYSGGGVTGCTMENCVVSGNNSGYGGGANYNCLMINCSITGNNASYGGGVYDRCTLYNCRVWGNSAGGYGGGAYGCTLNNCTISGNTAQLFGGYGGGAYSCTLNNCIVYFNTGGAAGPDIYSCTLNFCCTPISGGTGNITNAPLFVNQAGGDLHLLAGSGGIDAGTNAYVASLTDLDGNLRIANGTVDMGAYEYQQPNPAIVSILCNYTDVVVGIAASFQGIVSRGRTVSWNFGDGTVISNKVSVTHSWAAPGDYTVTLTIFDSSNPNGASGFYLIHVILPPLSYVDPGSANPVPPFSSWQTAATNIQDAVDAVVYGAHILVTNGIYQSGGRVVYGALTNRVALYKPVVVQSVNGPTVTAIQGNPTIGDSGVRCVYLTNGASLSGFTLRNGGTRAAGDSYREQSGAGAWCATNNAISNCLLVSNAANALGGGVYGGSLSNCSLIANSALGSGGGAYRSTLNGCLLSNNTAIISYGGISGGGASSCTLVDCTLVSNITDTPYYFPASGGGAVDSTLTRCALTGNSAKDGGGANNSTLTDCRLVNNTAGNGGGAAAASTLVGCLMISNSAAMGGGCYDSAGTNCVVQQNTSGYQGGGACGSYLYNSLITGNAAPGSIGGGAAGDPSGTGCTLVNCTVVGNSAYYRAGGVADSTVWNSIVVSNTASDSPNWSGGTLNYCCTTPLPDTGVANITDAPIFAAGSFQLDTNSPCINAGSNSPALPATDLAGNPRIIAGTVDLGPYECPSPALLRYFLWMQRQGLPTTSAAASLDADGDGADNYDEWRAGTIPTNALSVFRVVGVSPSPAGASVTWQSVPRHSYWLEQSTNLGAESPFHVMATNIPGVAGPLTYTDTSATNGGAIFYRVGVQ